ncbi:hypothetical protein QQP08_025170 [Theobroma cacao]|nr:hypothetical protein QQP08_025170 [Theobroma cacao]
MIAPVLLNKLRTILSFPLNFRGFDDDASFLYIPWCRDFGYRAEKDLECLRPIQCMECHLELKRDSRV